MSSTAITFFKATSVSEQSNFSSRKNIIAPLLVLLGILLVVALSVYFTLMYKSLYKEHDIQGIYAQIAKLEEENSSLESRVSEYDALLQSEEQLGKMELVKNSHITYIERTTGSLVLAPMQQ
jgi:cell division protein FtsL